MAQDTTAPRRAVVRKESEGLSATESVHNAASLTRAIAGTATHILVASGYYGLTVPLEINRSVTVEAEILGAVVIDAHALNWSAIAIVATAHVQLIGLNVTRGDVRTETTSE
jgi:hypothetical protein